jgi:hypothetical protein
MVPIDEALGDLKLREEGEQLTLREIADKYGVERSTLGRRWRGVTSSKEEGPLNAQDGSMPDLYMQHHNFNTLHLY